MHMVCGMNLIGFCAWVSIVQGFNVWTPRRIAVSTSKHDKYRNRHSMQNAVIQWLFPLI